MSVLALMAAESQWDGGAGLHLLLRDAKFNERPRLSLTKFDERPYLSVEKVEGQLPVSKRFAA